MRVRWFLGLASVLLAVISTTVVVHDRLDEITGGGDQVIGAPSGATEGASGPTSSTVQGTADPGSPGLLRVDGSVTAVHLEGAVLEPQEVPTPLTLVSDRGFGNGAELTGVTVNGRPSVVVWDGGRPFVLSSGPGLVLDPLTVDLVPEGVRLGLGGGAHRLVPGPYRLDTPVAVGGEGIATSREAVDFVAGDSAQLEAKGDASLVLGPTGEVHLTGPGVVHLEGRFSINRAEGAQEATSLDLAEGPFDIVLSPVEGGGWLVSATLQSRG